MTELEKIAYAKSFIDKLAQGINPIDNSILPDSDSANNIRISRCYRYVSEILEKVIENGGCETKKHTKKLSFTFTEEQKNAFPYSDIPLSVSDIAKLIKGMTDCDCMKNLPAQAINAWLIHIGALYETTDRQNKKKKLPTPDGESFGIVSERRMGMYGEYIVVMYTKRAQQFIIDNIDGITAFYEETKARRREEKSREE